MASITIKVELTNQFLGDVLTTAIESGYDGIGSWAHLTSLTRVHVTNEDCGGCSNDEHCGACKCCDVAVIEMTIGGVEQIIEGVDDLTIVSAVIEDAEGEGEDAEFSPTTINLETIRLGLERIMDGRVPLADFLMNPISRAVREADPDIDAWGADAIVQAGLFGEVVFS